MLVTNYRDFLLLGEDDAGNPAKLEAFSLAANKAEFWRLAGQPRKAVERPGRPLVEYLTRALTHKARLADPKDVAWHLASYARCDALARAEARPGLPVLAQVKAALEGTLGIAFEGPTAGCTSSAPPSCRRCFTACSRLGCSGPGNTRREASASTGARRTGT